MESNSEICMSLGAERSPIMELHSLPMQQFKRPSTSALSELSVAELSELEDLRNNDEKSGEEEKIFHENDVENTEDLENDFGQIVTINDLETFSFNLREDLIDAVSRLACHVPNCVLVDIYQEACSRTKEIQMENCYDMPLSQKYHASLLFIDMSGFTVLSQALDVESLSKAINSYFQAIVDEIVSYGGDILKFAGDAIFAEWRVKDSKKRRRKSYPCSSATSENTKLDTVLTVKRDRRFSCKGINTYDKNTPSSQQPSSAGSSDHWNGERTIEECVHLAALCGAMIVDKWSDYPIHQMSISGGKGPLVATLNVHCGLGFGEMAGVHVGNDNLRREYLFLGDPIDQVAEACDSAQLGEIRASAEALHYLNKGQSMTDQLHLGKGEKSKIIALREKRFFNGDMQNIRPLYDKRRTSVTPHPSVFHIPFDDMNDFMLEHFHKILSSYVHPVVLGDKSFSNLRSSRCLNYPTREEQRADAELRSVFTLFIMPVMDAKLSEDHNQNILLFRKLNAIMNAVASILESYRGHLRQYIVDDKGIILIGTFGLRGSTFTNMVPVKALPTCRTIHRVLKEDIHVECQVGATLGKAYCGVVGGVKRHEYAVLGPSVNLAARLMGQTNHPGVLVDDDVRRKARGTNFVAFPPVKAKGYKELVHVYKPLTAKEAEWGRVNPKFVGRRRETNLVRNLAMDVTKPDQPSKILFVWGESGSGKTSFILYSIVKARYRIRKQRKSVSLTRNMSREGDSLVPFSLFRAIFRQVLVERSSVDESTVATNENGSGSHIFADWEAGSATSRCSSNFTEGAFVMHRLTEICDEMNAPRGFLAIVGQHLLGRNKGKVQKLEQAPEINQIITFMAKVFVKCTENFDTAILVLDDVQWMDSLSWKVLECILETSPNVFMVCGSRPKDSSPLSLSDALWKKLTGEYKKSGVFSEVTIAELDENDIRQMAAITFACDPSEVDDELLDDVFTHSGGMPYFASEILDNCVRKDRCGRLENGKVGWKENNAESRDALKFASIEELFLQRLDSLNDMTRKFLQFATILGMTFSFKEIFNLSVEVTKPTTDEMASFTSSLNSSIKMALDEDILDEKFVNPDEDDLEDDEDSEKNLIEYSFHHDTWRRVIRSLMLDSYVLDIHKHAAISIEKVYPNEESRTYRTNVELLRHYKGSEDTLKTAKISLSVGNEFKTLGMTEQSIKIYEDSIDLWARHSPPEGTKKIAGFSPLVLQSLDGENLVSLIKVMTNLGQASGSIHGKTSAEKSESGVQRSVAEFQKALEILSFAPANNEVKDRSFTFPIYSGLFFLLKYGAVCEPSKVAESEIYLVRSFVSETKLHGDPVHYGRALAMEGETCLRHGKFEESIRSHAKLVEVYNAEKHSALVVASYASDRCAQNFGSTARSYVLLGQIDKALELADYIEFKLMPNMDLKNVHNSVCILYPLLWMLKDNGQIERAFKLFTQYVTEPFDKYYGKDGSTPFLSAFKPCVVLFNTLLFIGKKHETLDQNYFDWALDINNTKSVLSLERAIGNFGRGPMSISAEACLKLSKLIDDSEKKQKLLNNGVTLAEQSKSTCDGSDGDPVNHFGYRQIEPVLAELKDMLAG